MRALTPSNIVAGFRKCGVHPFNRNAIITLDSVDSDSSEETVPTSNNTSISTDSASNTADATEVTVAKTSPANTTVTKSLPPPVVANYRAATSPDMDNVYHSFSPEKIELFSRRYEEGYNIPDIEYESWLKIAHPETSIAGTFQDVPTLNPVGASDDEILAHETPPTSPEMFSSPVASPSFVLSSASDSGLSAAVSSQTSMSSSEVPVLDKTPASNTTITEVNSPESASHASTSHASVLDGATPSLSNTSTSTKVSPLAKYLTLPDATPKSRMKTPDATKMRAMTGARVLTSVECFAIIKEQEQKKKQQEEEKMRRKKEREVKRQQKLEEKQRKAEEKAKRVEENARKAEEKLREKERRKAEKEQREREKAEQREKHNSARDGTHKRILRSRCGHEDQPTRLDDVIEPNRCCVCYEDYVEEESIEWVQCPCSRWLHEECIIDTRVNSFGKELLCPHCV